MPAPRLGLRKEKVCQTLNISVPGSDTKKSRFLDPGVLDGRCPERETPARLPPPGAGDFLTPVSDPGRSCQGPKTRRQEVTFRYPILH